MPVEVADGVAEDVTETVSRALTDEDIEGEDEAVAEEDDVGEVVAVAVAVEVPVWLLVGEGVFPLVAAGVRVGDTEGVTV